VTACVVVPQCVAYASLAGLPIQVGLYIATVPMVLYAVLGTSRPLSVSTTSTISLLTASAVEPSGASEPLAAASALAIIVGVVLLVVGLLRLGFLEDLVSSPILTGFKTGTGLVIISGQLGKLMGIPVGGTSFFSNIDDVLDGLGDIDGLTLALGVGTIVMLVVLHRGAPRLPAPLIAVVLGIVLVSAFDLANHGVAVIGSVPSGLPGFAFPSPDSWGPLVSGALGIALMSAVESLAAGRALASKEDPPVDANRDLVALGAANLGAGVFQGYAAGGGLSQSAVNDQAGARTQLAEMVTGAVVVLVLTTLTGLLEDLADATLAALVIVAASGLIAPAAFRPLARIRTRDFGLALVALAGVLVFGILDGVLIAIAISIFTLVYQSKHRAVEVLGREPATGHYRTMARHPEAEAIPGLVIVRPRGPLSFANVERVRTEILAAIEQAQPQPRVLLCDLEAVADVEITALEVMARFAGELRDRGVQPWLAAIVGDSVRCWTASAPCQSSGSSPPPTRRSSPSRRPTDAEVIHLGS
jgi:sulfate permease, SulP family